MYQSCPARHHRWPGVSRATLHAIAGTPRPCRAPLLGFRHTRPPRATRAACSPRDALPLPRTPRHAHTTSASANVGSQEPPHAIFVYFSSGVWIYFLPACCTSPLSNIQRDLAMCRRRWCGRGCGLSRTAPRERDVRSQVTCIRTHGRAAAGASDRGRLPAAAGSHRERIHAVERDRRPAAPPRRRRRPQGPQTLQPLRLRLLRGPQHQLRWAPPAARAVCAVHAACYAAKQAAQHSVCGVQLHLALLWRGRRWRCCVCSACWSAGGRAMIYGSR